MKFELKVKGMHCKSCEVLLTDVLEDLGGKNINVDHKSGIVSLETNASLDEVKQAIIDEGYTV